MSKPYRGEIHDWAFLFHPEIGGMSIFGRSVGHPRIINWIRTSPIVSRVGDMVETKNSIYRLVGEENDFNTVYARQGRKGS